MINYLIVFSVTSLVMLLALYFMGPYFFGYSITFGELFGLGFQMNTFVCLISFCISSFTYFLVSYPKKNKDSNSALFFLHLTISSLLGVISVYLFLTITSGT